ncbi:MAG: hypothetical protein FWB91_13330 [Defluviitaleaceae bacterium]|nr:hypothetical protein [Defluviitaleaceae bacterium]
MFCAYCGNKIMQNSVFCSSCGKSVVVKDTEVVSEQEPDAATTQKEDNTPTGVSLPRNKLIAAAVGIATIAIIAFTLIHNGGFSTSDPYGLNGFWQANRYDGMVSIFEFNGNRVTQITYRSLHTHFPLTVTDLERGGFSELSTTATRIGARPDDVWIVAGRQWWSHPGARYEIMNQEEDRQGVFVGSPFGPEAAINAYFTTIRESIEGTFSISDDGRIEFVWPAEIRVRDFSRTENTMNIGYAHFTRGRAFPLRDPIPMVEPDHWTPPPPLPIPTPIPPPPPPPPPPSPAPLLPAP